MPPEPVPAGSFSAGRFALLLFLLLSLFAAFIALGTWQVHRRAWKLALIERVEQRVHAAPIAAPNPDAWTRIGPNEEYLRVRVEGIWLQAHRDYVKAVTDRGAGYWLLMPLQTNEGFIVLVNRGFVESTSAALAASPGPVSLTGLLRISEPKGGFLRHNDPAAHRWYSRDVAAIAASEALPAQLVAPYFIDADASANPESDASQEPVGGLTVLRFHNSHLVYAITWYTLALMVAGAAGLIGRQEWQRRSRIGDA